MAKKSLKGQKRLLKMIQAILLFKLIIFVEMAKKAAEERPSYYIFQADQLLYKGQKG